MSAPPAPRSTSNFGQEAAPADPAPLPIPKAAEVVNGLYTATDSTFTTTIESGLAFVKFYAPWCGHCKSMAAAWQQVSLYLYCSQPDLFMEYMQLGEAYQNNKYVKIVEVDCTVQSLCQGQQIKGYPTLILFRDGKEVY